MAIQVRVWYAKVAGEFPVSAVNVQSNDIDDPAIFPKENVLAIEFLTMDQGSPLVIHLIHSFDNYALMVSKAADGHAGVWGWDDDQGGWFRIETPLVNDGYPRPTRPPHMMGHRPRNSRLYHFTGALVSAEDWDEFALLVPVQ